MKVTVYLNALLGFALMTVPIATAQTVPPLMNYQGRLTDEAGAPLPNGPYVLQFALFDQAVGGSSVWQEQQTVSLLQGGFNVVLGTVNPALATVFTNANRFLQLTVLQNPAGSNVNQTILPRQQLLSSPYAFMASSLIKEFQDALCPPGTIVAFGGTTVPDGWFLCDGRAVSSAQYPRLFTAIGTSWGSGIPSSTTNFNLPDLRGMFLRGVNGGRNDGYHDTDASLRTNAVPVGRTDTGGLVTGNPANNVGSVQGDKLATHSHQWGATTSGDIYTRTLRSWVSSANNASITTVLLPYVAGTGGTGTARDDDAMQVVPTSASLYTSPASTIHQSGESRPRNAYVNYIIKY